VRWSDWLKPDGVIVVNDYKIRPLPVASGVADYPDNYLSALNEQFRVVAFDAGGKAEELGNARVMNVIMLGAMVEAFAMDAFDWDGALKKHVPPKFLEINRKAFETGRMLARKSS
jgi:indolepyruvate ferredoxin oxidoreductase beta subunit